MKFINKWNKKAWLVAASCIVFAGCQKMERPSLADYPKDASPPGGPLKFYTAFDGATPDPLMNAVDSVRANFPASNPLTFINGISGKAIQGASTKDKAIRYPSANDFAQSTSFTISYWMKSTPATDGEPEFIFSLPSKDYWHESALFLLIEKGGPDAGNSTPTQMAAKLAIQDHWVEFIGNNRLPNVLNGAWHHLAFVYDQATSKLTTYVDGQLFNNTSPTTTVMNGSNPRGPLSFRNVSNFVIGGWNKHADVSGPGDSWIHSYSGGMDQFRLYNKALTATEVQALFNTKR
jgi:hypothetical protein